MKRSVAPWTIVLALVVAIGGLTAAMPARAQFDTSVNPELSQDWYFRLGVFVAQSNTTRKIMGDVGISGTLERRVYAASNYDLLIGLGYNGFDKVYSIPLLINLILHHNNIRYGLGAGYSFGKRDNGKGSNGVALDLILGYQLTHTTNPLSLDLRYFFISGSSNELDGYSLTLGYKF